MVSRMAKNISTLNEVSMSMSMSMGTLLRRLFIALYFLEYIFLRSLNS